MGGRNVLGGRLQLCGADPLTGFFRTGKCETASRDWQCQVVCVMVTEEFLDFSWRHGIDLRTPRHTFPGLRPGDKWCLSGQQWLEAYRAGVAPPVFLEATHAAVLATIELEKLKEYAVDYFVFG